MSGLHHDRTGDGRGGTVELAGQYVVGDEAADQIVAGIVLFALDQLLNVGVHRPEGLRLHLLGRPGVQPDGGVVLEELEVFGWHTQQECNHE